MTPKRIILAAGAVAGTIGISLGAASVASAASPPTPTTTPSQSSKAPMGISAPCDHCSPASPWSASVVSFLPDGTDFQVVARGIRAPVGLAYYPATAALFVTMNQRDDLGARTPGDWLAVVKPGQDWRFPACFGQGGADCAGVPSPLAVLDKHAAVGDVAIVTGQLGRGVADSALVAEWSDGKVQRVPLGNAGSTVTATAVPFLTGVAKPVAVTLGPDGALYVGDWASGTIYRVAGAAA
jgi:glucose/arabinose dehydrogenase